MIEKSSMSLSWEKSSQGSPATRWERPPIGTSNPLGIASLKANDIAMVNASFQGEQISFEPYVRLWIKRGKEGTGLTVLMNNYPNNGEHIDIPDVCIRLVEWRGETSIEDFTAADNKQHYVLENLPLQCIHRFYRSDEILIDDLMKRTSLLLAGGITFVKVERPEMGGSEVNFEFCDGLLFFSFSFFSGSFSNGPLEKMIQEWLAAAQFLQSCTDHAPDSGGVRIAYRESIWERIARYSQEQK